MIHHLSTQPRRVQAIASVLGTLIPQAGTEQPIHAASGGRVLIYVWALEQKHSRRGWDEGDQQDVTVPWIMNAPSDDGGQDSRTFHRYYHLYRQGELERDVVEAGGSLMESGYEKDNWWAIAKRGP